MPKRKAEQEIKRESDDESGGEEKQQEENEEKEEDDEEELPPTRRSLPKRRKSVPVRSYKEESDEESSSEDEQEEESSQEDNEDEQSGDEGGDDGKGKSQGKEQDTNNSIHDSGAKGGDQDSTKEEKNTSATSKEESPDTNDKEAQNSLKLHESGTDYRCEFCNHLFGNKYGLKYHYDSNGCQRGSNTNTQKGKRKLQALFYNHNHVQRSLDIKFTRAASSNLHNGKRASKRLEAKSQKVGVKFTTTAHYEKVRLLH